MPSKDVEREMTKEDWIAMHSLMKIMEQVCLHGIVNIRPQMREALQEVMNESV